MKITIKDVSTPSLEQWEASAMWTSEKNDDRVPFRVVGRSRAGAIGRLVIRYPDLLGIELEGDEV